MPYSFPISTMSKVFFLETGNLRVNFSKYCLGLVVQAGKKKNTLSNLPVSKNIVFHISRHKLTVYSLAKTLHHLPY